VPVQVTSVIIWHCTRFCYLLSLAANCMILVFVVHMTGHRTEWWTYVNVGVRCRFVDVLRVALSCVVVLESLLCPVEDVRCRNLYHTRSRRHVGSYSATYGMKFHIVTHKKWNISFWWQWKSFCPQYCPPPCWRYTILQQCMVENLRLLVYTLHISRNTRSANNHQMRIFIFDILADSFLA